MLQHEGREGRVRPQSARPSDHWPAGGAPGQLQARRRPSPTAGPPARTPRAPARSSASRRPATRPATTPSPAPPSHTESAVLAALKKSGLLERLGNGGTPDRAASSVKRCACDHSDAPLVLAGRFAAVSGCATPGAHARQICCEAWLLGTAACSHGDWHFSGMVCAALVVRGGH